MVEVQNPETGGMCSVEKLTGCACINCTDKLADGMPYTDPDVIFEQCVANLAMQEFCRSVVAQVTESTASSGLVGCNTASEKRERFAYIQNGTSMMIS